MPFLYPYTSTTASYTLSLHDALPIFLIDLQDVGARFYTFASTVSLCMAAAADADLPVILLDRPNPIGSTVEGPSLQAPFRSEEHTSELQSRFDLVCRLLLEKKK